MREDSFVILFYNVLSVTVDSVSLYAKRLLKLNTSELKTLSKILLKSLSIKMYVVFFACNSLKILNRFAKGFFFLNYFHFEIRSS